MVSKFIGSIGKKGHKAVQHAFSGSRDRLVEGEYDLDLTYITDDRRLIAMGYPAEGMEGMYRNSIDEVSKYLAEKHGGQLKIWNLSEKPYDYSKFDDNVVEFGWPDHHAPPLDVLKPVIEGIHQWLTSGINHVAAVHCLAGKGRTGIVMVCYLVYIGMFEDIQPAIDYFLNRRKQGVHYPSQIRYIRYFKSALQGAHQLGAFKEAVPVVLKKIKIHNLPKLGGKLTFNIFHCKPRIIPKGMETVQTLLYTTDLDLANNNDVIACGPDVVPLLRVDTTVHMWGDILVQCKLQSGLLGTVSSLFRFNFHTGYCPLVTNESAGHQTIQWRFRKWDMDDYHKNKKMADNICVDLVLEKDEREPNSPLSEGLVVRNQFRVDKEGEDTTSSISADGLCCVEASSARPPNSVQGEEDEIQL